MTAYSEEHRETLLLGVVLGKFAEAVVESRAFSWSVPPRLEMCKWRWAVRYATMASLAIVADKKNSNAAANSWGWHLPIPLLQQQNQRSNSISRARSKLGEQPEVLTPDWHSLQ